MAGRAGSRWGALWASRHVQYARSPLGALHLALLALSVLCTAFAGHYLGMYRGVHLPGYDLFRPETFFVIIASGCLMVAVLLLVTVLVSADSQELLFRTLAPELAFGAMAGLWLVASIVYLAEIVGRNIDYQHRELGFPLKIISAVLALAASCVSGALCLLSRRHRVGASSLLVKTPPSVELGRSSRPLTIELAASTVDSTPVHSVDSTPLRAEHRRLERAPSSPPCVGGMATAFPFSATSVSSSAMNLQVPSESVRRLTEKTLSHSISLKRDSTNSAPIAASSTPISGSPEYARVSKPPRRASGGSTGESPAAAAAAQPLAASATELGGKTRPAASRQPPLPRGPPGAGRAKPPSGRPPAPPAAYKKPTKLHSGSWAQVRDMRRSVSTPNDVDEPLNADVDEPTFASSDHLEKDPANLTFAQRRKMLEQRQAGNS